MAKMTTDEFIAAIKELSVLELNDLVKACEEEFGVSAAAGVVVAAGAGAGAAAAEEKDEFDVELTEVGAQKVKVIKVVREASLTALPRSSRKVLTRQPLKSSRSSSKRLAQRLLLSNLRVSYEKQTKNKGEALWHLCRRRLFFIFEFAATAANDRLRSGLEFASEIYA